ncbi:hypothetical protein [Persephonella sp. KM09-Lau-8]|uniref:hypothetical protein n=1 Tax=Persephonella sp. KM09-Lau-8 TaxID=1158345 RepID=UPI000495B552|nr:hypothetical protein [Persephonella sp. KM09-Lau-8]
MKLKVIPAFTGREYQSIDEILKDKKAKKLLWAEILFNDEINWEKFKDKIKEDYKKVAIFYTNFRYLFKRKKPLPEIRERVDEKEIRRFEEIYRFLNIGEKA